MHYFQPDPFTRASVAIPSMVLQPAFISAGDITNRALIAAIPQGDGTNALLERGYAAGVEWMECPDGLWASVSPHLQGLEATSATATKPTGYARDNDRPRMATLSDRVNVVAITDSLGWNGGSGTAGTDSYVTQAFQAWAGATRAPWQGDPTAEYMTSTKALLHNGNGGSFFGGVNATDFSNDHEMMRPVKYTTLNMSAGDIFYVALGTNDWSNDGAADGAAVWSRAQTFIGGLISDHPTATIIAATIPRRSETAATNDKIAAFNTLLKAGYAALGVDKICDIEQAHPDFSTSTGDSAGSAYLDGTHFSDVGIAAAKTALAATLQTI